MKFKKVLRKSERNPNLKKAELTESVNYYQFMRSLS